jgi:hypothetical protein
VEGHDKVGAGNDTIEVKDEVHIVELAVDDEDKATMAELDVATKQRRCPP